MYNNLGANAKKFYKDKQQEKKIDDLIKQKERHKEGVYGPILNKMGRNAFFTEYFDGVKLEDQIIKIVGPYENPRETASFKEGYQRGEFLAKTGVIPEEYQRNEKHR